MLLRFMCCIFGMGFCLYAYIDQHNVLMRERIHLPLVAKELMHIQQKNIRLQYEVSRFENPQHLMELARRAEYQHLKHPLMKDVLSCQEGLALQRPSTADEVFSSRASRPTLAAH